MATFEEELGKFEEVIEQWSAEISVESPRAVVNRLRTAHAAEILDARRMMTEQVRDQLYGEARQLLALEYASGKASRD